MLPPILVRAIATVVLIAWPLNLAVDYIWDRGEPLVNVIFTGLTGSLFLIQKNKKADDDDS
jgi:hypothetical protein